MLRPGAVHSMVSLATELKRALSATLLCLGRRGLRQVVAKLKCIGVGRPARTTGGRIPVNGARRRAGAASGPGGDLRSGRAPVPLHGRIPRSGAHPPQRGRSLLRPSTRYLRRPSWFVLPPRCRRIVLCRLPITEDRDARHRRRAQGRALLHLLPRQLPLVARHAAAARRGGVGRGRDRRDQSRRAAAQGPRRRRRSVVHRVGARKRSGSRTSETRRPPKATS